MTLPTHIERHVKAIQALIARHRASNPPVFGSISRRTAGASSDLDLLVDALPGTTMFDLGGLQEDLEALLGIRGDVRTPGDLPARIRKRVLAEARML